MTEKGRSLVGSQPKAISDGVSRRMLIAIIAMLAIILLPVIVASVPLSKVVVTITNSETDLSATCHLSVYGTNYANSEMVLEPGEEIGLSYTVMAGTYQVFVYYSFLSEQYYGRSFSTTVSLSIFETEKVEVTLYK